MITDVPEFFGKGVFKDMKRKKWFSVFVALVMAASLIPAAGIGGGNACSGATVRLSAVNKLSTYDADGRPTVRLYAVKETDAPQLSYLACDGEAHIPDAMAFPLPENNVLDCLWYKADGKVTVPGDLTVSGDVNLILKDGCELTVDEGVRVPEGSSLTIYAQSEGDDAGELIATGAGGSAGIGGGGNITIHGGIIEATGGTEEDFFGGAGIGGNGRILSLYDDYYYSETEEIIFINTGATGTVCIYGGDITATGGYYSAGIGGGYGCDAGNISIYGGNISATGQDGAPGIGGGMADCWDMWDTVTVPVTGGTIAIDDAEVISNGKKIAHKHDFSTGVYKANDDGTHSEKCLYCEAYGNTEAYTFDGEYINDGGTHSEKCSVCGAYGNTKAHTFKDHECVCGAIDEATYLYYDEEDGKLKQGIHTDCEVISETHCPTPWKDGRWYVVKGEPVIKSDVAVWGDVHLILTDGCVLTIKKGTIGGKRLYIHSQSTGSSAGRMDCYGHTGNYSGDYGGVGSIAISVTDLTVIGAR